jgi:L-lactate dehydrogenase complex protein LldG
MTGSRDAILKRLRDAGQPLAAYQPVSGHLPMVPLADTSPKGLLARYVEQATKLSCTMHRAASDKDAVRAILEILGDDQSVLCWPFEHIPLSGLAEALKKKHIDIAESPRDASVRVGITGVDAALAATGSLVLIAGPGKHRVTSLLPPVHIAVVRASQIVAGLEAWVASQRAAGIDAFRAKSSAIVISGPSRTADIAMQLILGMHGPGELHVVLLE